MMSISGLVRGRESCRKRYAKWAAEHKRFMRSTKPGFGKKYSTLGVDAKNDLIMTYSTIIKAHQRAIDVVRTRAQAVKPRSLAVRPH